MQATKAALDAQRAARGETGSLRIGFNNSALLSMLPPVLRRFRVEHPEVRLQLEEMVTVKSSRALVAGELDVIICRGAPRGRGVEQLVSVEVSSDYMIGIVSTDHPLAGQQRISLDQLRRQPLVIALPEDEPAVIKTLHDVLPDLGAWPGVTRAGDTHTIMGLAACGFGVGLGPQDMRTAARPDTWMFDIRPRRGPHVLRAQTHTEPARRKTHDGLRVTGVGDARPCTKVRKHVAQRLDDGRFILGQRDDERLAP